MGETRDDFSRETTRTLGERVGLLCSNAECRVLTKAAHTDDERSLSVGVACHISAAARGGPRYDETQTSEDRSAISNGLWLCAKCATLIDKDPARYPVQLLRQWKMRAEREATERIGKPYSAPREATGMSGDAAEIMAHLAREYVKGEFPNHKVWNFSFPIGNAVASELRALRMIETLGSRGRDTQAWRLTDAGQRWVMAHRVDTQSPSP